MDAACRRIENAQNELNSATADLSTLVGCVPVWKATSALADTVGELWRRVDNVRRIGKYQLDEMHVREITKR
jgi:hypothetical protein